MTAHELVVLAQNEVDPDYFRDFRAAGITDLTVNEVVAHAKKSLRQDLFKQP